MWVGAIFGALLVLEFFFILFLGGATINARQGLKDLQERNLRLAQAAAKLSEELAIKQQPVAITDEQLVRLAAGINNIRDHLAITNSSKTPGGEWKN